MLRLKPITFRARVLLYFSLQGLLLLTLIGAAVVGLEVTVEALDEASSEMVDELQPVHDLQFNLASVDQVVMAALVDGNRSDRDKYRLLVRNIDRRLAFLLSDASPFDSSEEHAVVQGVKDSWHEARLSIEPLMGEGNAVLEHRQFTRVKKLLENINHSIANLNTIYDIALQEIQQEQHHAVIAKSHSMRVVIAILVVGLSAMLLALFIISRTVLRPIRLLVDASSELGKGNLNTRVPLHDNDELGQLAESFNTMASQLAEHQEKLVKLATHDGLTGLYNHAEFMKRLDIEIERTRRYRRPLSILMLDIDCFKAVNDQFGHVVGDKVLGHIAGLLKEQVRPADFCARYGGEEFTVILPETDASSAASMAERIRESVEAKSVHDNADNLISVTISIGVAEYVSGETPLRGFVDAADRALYEAKDQGRNRVIIARRSPRELVSRQN